MEIYNLADIILDNIYILLLLPLWIFLIIMCGRFVSVYVNKGIIYFLTLLSSLLGVLFCSTALIKLGADKVLENSFPFIKINDFILSFGIYIDRAALIFALVLFLVSFAVQLFSISFMKKEKKNYRFYALLNLFNFAMAGLFFSPNLFQSYLFWELVGVISYLLIGFEYSKNQKSVASKKVFIINRIGDTAFIGAIVLSSYFVYEYSGNPNLTTLSFSDMNVISTIVYAYTSTALFWIICGLFILAAVVKSAQFPFYTWLIDAMEAKLPVSSLLHSATMVASGVFILLRLTSFFTLQIPLLRLIAIIGILTAIICSLSACAQSHPKKALAYSTSSQLGLMFLAIGFLNIKAAIILFVAHAFIKSTLFLTLPRENEKWNYVNFILFLIAGLSLSGLTLSGLASKEGLFIDLGNTSKILFCIISFLTAFYIIRIAILTAKNHELEKQLPSKFELGANIILLVLNIIFYIYLRKYYTYKIEEPFWWSMFAWGLVYILYLKHKSFRLPVLYPLCYNGFYLDNLYTGFVNHLYSKICNIANWIEAKIFTNYKPILFTSASMVKITDTIENDIMMGAVKFITKTSKRCSYLYSKLQSGNIQKYNAYAFIIITLILTSLVIAYTAIITYIGG